MTLARRPETRVTDWLSLTTEEFAADRIAVLPVAAVEQHGPHLPVGVDTYIAEAYLARVRALLPADFPAVFLPVQAIGASDEHRAFRGTLTLSPQTALAAFIEIGESVHRAGIRKLVIINSHGGNIALIDLAARQLRVRHSMLAVHASWGRFGYPEGLFTRGRTHARHPRRRYRNLDHARGVSRARAAGQDRGLSGRPPMRWSANTNICARIFPPASAG